jgi:hypothetical protein
MHFDLKTSKMSSKVKKIVEEVLHDPNQHELSLIDQNVQEILDIPDYCK